MKRKKNDHIHGWHASERKFPHSYEMKGVYSIWLNSFHSFCFTFYHYIFTIRAIGSSGRAQYVLHSLNEMNHRVGFYHRFIIINLFFFTYLRNVITFCIFMHVDGVCVCGVNVDFEMASEILVFIEYWCVLSPI